MLRIACWLGDFSVVATYLVATAGIQKISSTFTHNPGTFLVLAQQITTLNREWGLVQDWEKAWERRSPAHQREQGQGWQRVQGDWL